MSTYKRILSFILATVMVAGMLPAAAWAAETESTEVSVVTETTVPVHVPQEATVSAADAVTESAEQTEASAGETAPEIPVEETLSFKAVGTAVVASEKCGDNVTWTLDDGGTLTVSGKGEMWDNYRCGGDYYTEIQAVVIQSGVTGIGDFAFSLFKNLKSVTIPESVTSIGASAFYGCSSLTEAAIPKSVTTIGGEAFRECGSLLHARIPDGVTSIEYGTFMFCTSLADAWIGKGVSDIGTNVFYGCKNLAQITVSPENASYCSDEFGVLFTKDMMWLEQAPGGIGGVYEIPDGVWTIDYDAFLDCDGLTGVIIPDSVKWIIYGAFSDCDGLTTVAIPPNILIVGNEAFSNCRNLKSIYFKGNAPTCDSQTFRNVTANVYYPENNSTWEGVVGSNWGGSLTWGTYTPSDDEEPGIPVEYHNTLDELTEVDFMAFSKIAYEDFSGCDGMTVKEALKGKWKSWFNEKQGIRYSDLCKHIAKWKVCMDQDTNRGFYAVAFENEQKEAVIAYRGSTSPVKILTADGAQDWLINDIPTQIFNVVWASNNQYELGFDFYKAVQKKGFATSSIAVTGHSLGGGLANIVSARYGCKGVTMNAICILDAIYQYAPLEMGENFDGVDKWQFMDHANVSDLFAGMYEYYWTPLGMVKPVTAHASNTEISSLSGALSLFAPIKIAVETLGDLFSCHGMETYVKKDRNGNVVLTGKDITFKPKKQMSVMVSPITSLDLGTSKNDTFNKGFSATASRHSFGGKGADKINTSINFDQLFGGKEDDVLDGSWGDDDYVYYKGDGCDKIYDVGGKDKLILMGFSDSDIIDAVENEDSDFITIRCNLKPIVNIYKKNRNYKDKNSDTFRIWTESTKRYTDISELFRKRAYDDKILVQCPVNVEILDAEGNVVYTLEDGNVGSYYTDYGNFYIYEEENGGYGKSLDLVEGYTARIVGQDSGTMKIDHWDVTDTGLSEEAKHFAEVPISDLFTATFEEADDGELLLAADTDGDRIVDVKIGYDGNPIPVESVAVTQEYVLIKPEESTQLSAAVAPEALSEFIRWSVEAGGEEIISVDAEGNVTAHRPGTAYALATVTNGEFSASARCRIDVAETEIVEATEKIRLDGVRLNAAKLTAELFSTNYTNFEVLLMLPQNYAAASTENRRPENNGVAVQNARFADPAAAEIFDLTVLDDRTLAVVPTEFALSHPKELKGSYSSAVTVTVQDLEYTTEALTVSVKKTMPKLKAAVGTFNSFFPGQTQPVSVTGATVTGIALDPGKTQPDWLTMDAGNLTLTEHAPRKNVSGKVYLLVETEEWAVPAEIALTVKNAYKEPVLKLSAKSITLNTACKDSAVVTVTVNPADYDLSALDYYLTDSTGKADKNGEVDVSYGDGKFTLGVTEHTEGPYKLHISTNGSKETILTVKTVRKDAEVSFKVSGNPDLGIPGSAAVIKPTFKNYSGAFTLVQPETEWFTFTQNGSTISVRCKETAYPGNYTLRLTLALADGSTVENTVKISVKRTAVKLKLSASKLTLNKQIGDKASVTVTSATKGYTLTEPTWLLVDKSGKASAAGKLDVSWTDGKLLVGTNDSSECGATYKVLVRADAEAPVQVLTVTVLAENKSAVTATLKAKGSLDVIRSDSALTITPSYKNCAGETEKEETLIFTKTVGKETTDAEALFIYTKENGIFTVTKAPGAVLDQGAKYAVKLVTTINGTIAAESKPVNLTVKMGTAKLTVKTADTTLFAKDCKDRALVWFESADDTLNDIARVEFKNAKQSAQFELIDYGNGQFAIGFRDGKVDKSLIGKSVTVSLNVFIEGNRTAKANAAANVKLTIVK